MPNSSPLIPARTPRLDFDAGLSTDIGTEAVKTDEALRTAREARPSLATACSALIAAAQEWLLLDGREMDDVARTLADLPEAVHDPAHRMSESNYRAYLEGPGAAQLNRLACMLRRPTIPTAQRREHLRLVVDRMLHACLEGLRSGLEPSVDTLENAAGGPLAAAIRARDALRRETLEAFVRRTMGRDPMRRDTLNSHFPHYLSRLEQQLEFPGARERPMDIHFLYESWATGQVKQAQSELIRVLTPVSIARRMAEEGLLQARQHLRENQVDPACIDLMDEWQYVILKQAWEGLSNTLGTVAREHLIEEIPETDGIEESQSRYRLAADAGLLTLGVLRHLEQARGLSESLPAPLPLTLWRTQAAQVEVQALADEVLWIRERLLRPQVGEAAEHERRLQFDDLQRLRPLCESDTRGARAQASVLSTAQRAAAARAALSAATESQLARLDPIWLVDADMAREWWYRLSSERRAHWWATHPVKQLPPSCLPALIAVADECGDWKHLRELLQVTAGTAAALWQRCDGAAAVAQALRSGDSARVDVWLTLLEKASRLMRPDEIYKDLSGKGESGASALVDAMLENRQQALRSWLEGIIRIGARGHAGQGLLMLLAGVCGPGRPAVAAALVEGRADPLTTYLEVVLSPSSRAALGHEAIADLLASGAGWRDRLESPPALQRAAARDHGEVMAVWLSALLQAGRERLLGRGALVNLIAARTPPPKDEAPRIPVATAYSMAMKQGATRAQQCLIDALADAMRRGLLSRRHAVTLLLGDADDAHGPSLAALEGRLECLDTHLDAEARLLHARGPFTRITEPLWRHRLFRRGAHTAIDAAMRRGDAGMVRRLVKAALDPDLGLPGDALIRAFRCREPGGRHALRLAVERDNAEAITAWIEGVGDAAQQGRLRRSELRALLRAEEGDDSSALLVAVDHSPTMAAHVADRIVAIARRSGLRSRDLLSLLGHRYGGDVPSPLGKALMLGRVETVSGLMAVIRRAWQDRLLDTGHLGRLMSMRRRDGVEGLAAAVGDLRLRDRRIHAAVNAYATQLMETMRRGAIPEHFVGLWLFDALKAADARPLLDGVAQAVRTMEQQGLLSTPQLRTLRRAMVEALNAAPAPAADEPPSTAPSTTPTAAP